MPWSIVGVVACFLVFGLLSLRWPCNPSHPKWVSRETADDALYFLTNSLVLAGLSVIFTRWIAEAAGGASAVKAVQTGYGWLARLPLAAQVAIIFVAADILQYWLHRAFHSRGLWPFHAIHHSATRVDWTTTFRNHPVNYLGYSTSVAVLTQLMGFSPAVFVIIAPMNLALGAMVHANLDWTFGPFKYVLASPVFHRWHHSRDAEARDKNFAPTFPVLDLMFGTFHMPEGQLPEDYGVDGAPEHFLGQLAYPFRPWLEGRRFRPGRTGLSSTL